MMRKASQEVINETLEQFKKVDNEYWELVGRPDFNDDTDDSIYILRALMKAINEVERETAYEKKKIKHYIESFERCLKKDEDCEQEVIE